MAITQQYNPTKVAPDKAAKFIEVNEMIEALNMRANASDPNGGTGFYRINGNDIIANALLPAGTNKAIGWCADRVGRRLIWANYNATASLQTIFCYSQTNGFEVILQQDLGWSSTTEVSMDFANEILTWTSIDVEDPREINVTRALAGDYDTPLEPWQLAQLHRPPAYPLQLFANTPPGSPSSVFAIAIQQPKPYPDTVLQGYLFSYNYEYLDNLEGRRSQPSFVSWNNDAWLIVPDEEFDTYLKVDAATPNASIVAVRFYYQIGTNGAIHYFKRIKNLVANWLSSPTTDPALPGQHFGFQLPDLTELYDIGSPSEAALLEADGIERYVQDGIYADNRNVLSNFLAGYDFEFPDPPTVTVETDYSDADDRLRKYTIFPPITYPVPLALMFEDKYGRPIATQSLGNTTIQRPASYYFPIVDYAGDPDDQWWNTIIDSTGPFGYPAPYNLPSTSDMVDSGYIKIDPPVQVLPSDVYAVKLLTRPHIKINGFIRSLCNPYFIYGSPEIGLKLFYNNDNSSNVIDGVTYNFYGYGFEFRSGEPINFSTEQNYYIQVRGQTGPELATGDFTFNMIPGWTARESVFSDDFEFKITDQLGDVLISKQPYTAPPNPGSGAYSLLAVLNPPNPTVNGNTTGYYHSILDVILYSRVTQQTTQWVQVPNVRWEADVYAAGDARFYFGDAYFTADKKIANAVVKPVIYYGSGSTLTPFTDYNLGQMTWPGYFASPNLNGIFLEDWDSPFGSVSVLNEEPMAQRLSRTIGHSGAMIPGSKVNNNFVFNPLDRRTLPYQVGDIIKLILISVNSDQGNNVYAFCKNGVMMMFLGKVQQTGTDGNSVMSLATRVFGSENSLRFEFGIQKKKQVVSTNKGLAFAVDPINNVLFQLSTNGLDPISEQKLFVSNMADTTEEALIGYDPFFFEAVMAKPDEGVAYNFKLDSYQGKRTFDGTELFAWLSDAVQYNQMYSFFEGDLYRWNEDTGTINGEAYDHHAVVVVNADPGKNKEMVAVTYSGDDGLEGTVYNDKGQTTTLLASLFQSMNGVKSSSVKRDENSTGGIMNGEPMEDVIHFVKLGSSDNDVKDIVSIEVSYLIAQANIKQ